MLVLYTLLKSIISMPFNQLVAGSTPAGLTKILAEYRHYKLHLTVLLKNVIKVSTVYPQKNL